MSKLLTTIPQSYLTEKKCLTYSIFRVLLIFFMYNIFRSYKRFDLVSCSFTNSYAFFFFFLQFICFLFVSVTATILDLKLIQSIYESLIYGLHLVRFMVTPNKQNTQSKLEVKTFLYLWFVSNFHISQISKHAKKSNRFYYVGSCYLFTLLIS